MLRWSRYLSSIFTVYRILKIGGAGTCEHDVHFLSPIIENDETSSYIITPSEFVICLYFRVPSFEPLHGVMNFVILCKIWHFKMEYLNIKGAIILWSVSFSNENSNFGIRNGYINLSTKNVDFFFLFNH